MWSLLLMDPYLGKNFLGYPVQFEQKISSFLGLSTYKYTNDFFLVIIMFICGQDQFFKFLILEKKFVFGDEHYWDDSSLFWGPVS